ncbi:hypothetical protein DXG01_012864 [Tephrocybe rancida]|nr:hypothetical protein DXG01_012864 [Tephrocybe rancida]
MAIVVFQEGSTFRGKLKTLSKAIVVEEYKNHFDVPAFNVGNQEEFHYLVACQVKAVLKDGVFLCHGIDDQGRCNNIAHPAIGRIIIEFYYISDTGLARKFPAEFKKTIPLKALALVLTCIHNCLEEYEEGYRVKKSFSRQMYSRTYDAMIALIDSVLGDPYHADKLRRNLKNWAQIGSLAMAPKPAIGGRPLKFVAKLD